MDLIIQSAVSGMLVGGMYGLAAIGLALVFGVLKVLNVAHGELVMLGGYATVFLFTGTGLDPGVAIPLVFVLIGAVGLVLHLGLFRFVPRLDIEDRIKNSLLIAFGLTLILQALAVRFFTADERGIVTSYSQTAWQIGSLRLPVIRVMGVVVAIAAVLLLNSLLSRTTLGRAVRATSEDWALASLTGINIQQIYLIAFSIAAGLAGITGLLVSLGFSVSPSIGLAWTLKALVVVVLAGLGSIGGTVVAGLLLGLAEGITSVWLGGAYREIVALGVFVIVLLVRPQGLFGRRGA
jgi:branched-chain amino acid transport system permease protein